MKQAICIQCHDKPELVNFMIEHMPAEQFDFIVHVDAKSGILDSIVRRENVYFADRVDVQWGGLSQVLATLSLLRCAQSTGNGYSYVHLVSGNDVLIQSPSEFIKFFNANKKQYIESFGLPTGHGWSWGGEDRYSVWYPQRIIHRPKKRFFRFLRVAYREFIMRTKLFKRRRLPVAKFYGGSSWFSITGDASKWLVHYIGEHPEYLKFFRHGVCVDEIFFSTLIRYSPFACDIAGNNKRYIDWTGSKSGGPNIISEDMVPSLKASEDFFARKVMDIQTANEIWLNCCE